MTKNLQIILLLGLIATPAMGDMIDDLITESRVYYCRWGVTRIDMGASAKKRGIGFDLYLADRGWSKTTAQEKAHMRWWWDIGWNAEELTKDLPPAIQPSYLGQAYKICMGLKDLHTITDKKFEITAPETKDEIPAPTRIKST